MYQGLDKGGGGVIGSGKFSVEADFDELAQTSSAEEILVCMEPIDDMGNEQKVFMISTLNPFNGSVSWVPGYDEELVMKRTIGMSQMVSMLHDTDRNACYEHAIKKCIDNFRSIEGRAPIVLDIGTGTGLLAMLCIRHGAEFVVGCEMFEAMAEVAKRVIDVNGLSEKIMVISAKSSEIETLPFTCDIIVSELLDSILLGEGVLFSHADAISRFMSTESIPVTPLMQRVLPCNGSVYATLVQGQDVSNLVRVDNIAYNGITPWRNSYATSCKGGWRPIPVHWSEYTSRGCIELSEAHIVSSFSFSSIQDDFSGGTCTQIDTKKSGVVQGVLIWWKLDIFSDTEEEISYCTKPGSQKWQDHWTQAVYPLRQDLSCDEGSVFTVRMSTDGTNIWFEVTRDGVNDSDHRGGNDDSNAEEPIFPELKKIKATDSSSNNTLCMEQYFPPMQCGCGWHLLCGPERIQMLNDSNLYFKWHSAMLSLIQEWKIANEGSSLIMVDVSDGSILSLMGGMTMRNEFHSDQYKIVSLERKMYSYMFFCQLVEGNGLSEFIDILDEEDWNEEVLVISESNEDSDNGEFIDNNSIDILLCECFFYQLHALPVRGALSFMYTRNSLYHKVKSDLVTCPMRARVMMMAFELHDLKVSHGTAGM
jgi:protein arginine N-methyltransferase 7